MPDTHAPALTPDQWEAGDYRQRAHELDDWAKAQSRPAEEDSTEYVAKLGLTPAGSVIVMNRSHDRVLVPPPARAPLAAFALADQPFGFTVADVELIEDAAGRSNDKTAASALRDLAGRIRGLLPPT